MRGSSFDLANSVGVFDDVFPDQEFTQAAIFMHFLHNVTSADKLTFDINLRQGWPVRVKLDLLTDLLISQHIDVFKVFNVVCVEQNDYEFAEAALGHLAGTLHEHADIVFSDPLGNLVVDLVVG